VNDGANGDPGDMAHGVRYVVAREYRCAYDEPLTLRRGDIVRCEQRDSEWPGWLWCDDGRGRGGWVPESWVQRDAADRCTLLRDYCAAELTVSIGDVLEVLFTESGWAWARGAHGGTGWVPLDHIETVAVAAPAVHIRHAQPFDAEALARIYNHYLLGSHVTFDIEATTAQARRTWIGSFDDCGPHRLYVADAGDELLAYACSAPLRPKPAYHTSVETTVYVDHRWTHRGIGRRIYVHLLTELAGLREVHRAYAGIALPNPASVALHTALGFRHIGTFNEVGFKFGRYWDVAWYERNLSPVAEPRREPPLTD